MTSNIKLNQIGIVQNIKLTNIHLYNCELEYLRYEYYIKLVSHIEISIIQDKSIHYQRKKLYENKNIIDRYILECINDGILHNTNTNSYSDFDTDTDTDTDTNFNNVDLETYEYLSRYLFFNEMSSTSEVCSMPKKQTFKCSVYKNGQLLSTINPTS